MSEHVIEDLDDLSQPAENGELVHWMPPKPLRVGPAGVSATAGAAFTAGVVVTVAVLALIHWLGPQRELVAPRRRFRF
jgi:hypothetical protein